MDRDRPRNRPDDVACSVCREPADPERTRLLARGEDLLFVEQHCRACGRVTLRFILAPDRRLFRDTVRLAGAPPIGRDDVQAMHDQLEAWHGDLRSLLDGPPAGAGSAR